MHLDYDRQADALYVSVHDAPVSRTTELDPGTLVDTAEDGTLVGIEILNPARPWMMTVLTHCRELDVLDARRLAQAEALGVYEVIGDQPGGGSYSSPTSILVDA